VVIEQFHRFRGPGLGPALVDDELGQAQPSVGGQQALACDTKTSGCEMRLRGSSTPHPEVFIVVQQARRT